MMHRGRSTLLALAALVATAGPALTQTRLLSGVVKDSVGEPIFAAAISIGAEVVRTDSAGTFVIALPRADSVSVTIRRLGFERLGTHSERSPLGPTTWCFDYVHPTDTTFATAFVRHGTPHLYFLSVLADGATPPDVSTIRTLLDTVGTNFDRLTSVDPAVLRSELAVVRERAYATTLDEVRSGTASIAVPVFQRGDGSVGAGLGLVTSSDRAGKLVQHLPALRGIARRIEASVGAFPLRTLQTQRGAVKRAGDE